jgi:hypothetical protein
MVRLISTGDVIRPRRGVMSANLILFGVLSIGAVAFLVRFFIALCQASRGGRTCQVVRVGPDVYEIRSRRAVRQTVPLEQERESGTNGWRVYEIDERRNRRIVSTANKPQRRIIR